MSYRLIIPFTLILFFHSDMLSAQYYWKIVRRIDYHTSYNDVDFVDRRNGWIVASKGTGVGYNCTILHTDNGGESWQYQLQDINEYIWKVDFVDSLHGWVAGSNGTILSTKDGGNTWEGKNLPISCEVYDICFIDSLTGWVTAFYSDSIFHTTDGGSTWTTKFIKEGYSDGFSSVFFSDFNIGWLGRRDILKTTDGGVNWTIEFESEESIREFSFINLKQGWACQSTHTLRTSDGGLNWQSKFFGREFSFSGISFVDSSIGWTSGRETIGISFPVILITRDGGDNWYKEETEMQRGSLTAICCLDSCTGWAVGREGWGGYGIILKYARKPNSVQNNFQKKPDVESPELFQNYPNPFNVQTSISFNLPNKLRVKVMIYDINCRFVKCLIVDDVLQGGVHEIHWDGRNQNNEIVANGVYLCYLEYEGNFQVKKLIVLK